MDEQENPEYCDFNHNGQEHEWVSRQVGGDPQEQSSNEWVTVCKHCGCEKY